MKTITQKLAIAIIEDIIEHHEKFRGAYFFHSPGSSNSRRWYEEQNTKIEEFKVRLNGKLLRVSLSCDVSCSCRNVYYSSKFTIDGKKGNLRSVKTLLKKLQAKQKTPVDAEIAA